MNDLGIVMTVSHRLVRLTLVARTSAGRPLKRVPHRTMGEVEDSVYS